MSSSCRQRTAWLRTQRPAADAPGAFAHRTTAATLRPDPAPVADPNQRHPQPDHRGPLHHRRFEVVGHAPWSAPAGPAGRPACRTVPERPGRVDPGGGQQAISPPYGELHRPPVRPTSAGTPAQGGAPPRPVIPARSTWTSTVAPGRRLAMARPSTGRATDCQQETSGANLGTLLAGSPRGSAIRGRRRSPATAVALPTSSSA